MKMVADETAKAGLDVQIALKQAGAESSWNPQARSPAGALGLWQFMPATAARFGLSDPTEPVAATRARNKYMKFLLNRYNGDYRLALAGYNAGEGNVDKAIRRAGSRDWNAVKRYLPRPSETVPYVEKIAGGGAAQSFAGLGDAGGGFSLLPKTLTGKIVFAVVIIIFLAVLKQVLQ
ncbi:lytic transglycosylase domain-containing protein [Lactiplantibacillus plantarum]|uniref:lytic transglycosylase domain-containing protein n=1 Tax=Lactiplantibacillus plantarum TaxID=1590 RepID=UPI00325FD73E